MKILLINAELGYRGTPRTLANYARILKARHDVAIWGYHQGGETAEALLEEGFSVFIGEPGKVEAVAFSPDIVNFHRSSIEIPEETELLKLFRSRGAKCIETSVFGRVDRSIENLIDLSLQISEWDLYRWNAWKGSYGVTGVLFPNPVDTESFQRASEAEICHKRNEWNIPDRVNDRPFVLGRVGKTHWPFLLNPLMKALAKYPNLYFIHVGDYGGNSFPTALANHPRVRIQPRMNGAAQLSRFYSACDGCVNMSGNGESFGFVNAESMCCGTPVIALSTPLHDNAQLEMVKNGVGGYVLGNPDALVEAIGLLMGKSSPHRTMSTHCRSLIVDRYAMCKLGRDLLRIFEIVVSGGASQSLSQRLQCEGFVTDVSVKEMRSRMKRVLGRYRMGELTAARFLHSRFGYCLHMALKKTVKMIQQGLKQ